MTATSARDGSFALFGQAMQGEFRLEARALGFGRVQRPVRLGETAVSLRLARLGRLILPVRFPPGFVSRARLRVTKASVANSSAARPAGTRLAHTSESRVGEGGTTELVVNGLVPGVHELSLEIDAWPRAVWERKSFVIRSGEMRVHEPVDLTRALKRYRFLAQVARGQGPKDKRVALFLRSLDPSALAVESFEIGHEALLVIAPASRFAWYAHLHGRAPVQGVAVPGTTTIPLPARGAACAFTLGGLSERLRSMQGVVARLEFRRRSTGAASTSAPPDFARRYDTRVASLREDRATIHFEFPADSYEVSLVLEKPNRAGAPMLRGRAQIMSVIPQRIGATHRFEGAADVIARAVASLRRNSAK